MSLLISSETLGVNTDSHVQAMQRYQFSCQVEKRILETPPSLISRRNYLASNAKYIWFIKQGFVRTFSYTENGSVVALGIWGNGDIVGEPLSLIPNYFMEAITTVKAVPILIQDWQPPVELVIKYWQQTEALLLARSDMSVSLVLINVLNWLSKRFGQREKDGLLIDLNLTHQDLAELCGTSRVTITRLLKQLDEDGWIVRDSRKITLTSTARVWHYEI